VVTAKKKAAGASRFRNKISAPEIAVASSKSSYVEHNAKTGDDEDNDKAYLAHPYGRLDDLLYWDPDKIICEPPPHAVPGRFWRLFAIMPMLEQFNKISAKTMISDGREIVDGEESEEEENEQQAESQEGEKGSASSEQKAPEENN